MKTKQYKVAGHLFHITFDVPEEIEDLLPSCTPFLCEETNTTSLFELFVTSVGCTEKPHEEIGQFDCGGCNHGVYLMEDGGYQFVISNVNGVECCRVRVNADFSRAKVHLIARKQEERAFGTNNALMIVYAFATSPYNTLLIHSSVIRNNNKGYLFLGKSGTGKSTHTRLWLKHIPGSDLMNDDNPVIRVIEGKTFVYGSPWSGKTPCYRNIEAEAGAFVQLEQKKKNEIRREDILHSFAHILSSVSVMKWDKRVYNDICNTISAILSHTPVYHLGCLPDEEAARLSHQTVTSA